MPASRHSVPSSSFLLAASPVRPLISEYFYDDLSLISFDYERIFEISYFDEKCFIFLIFFFDLIFLFPYFIFVGREIAFQRLSIFAFGNDGFFQNFYFFLQGFDFVLAGWVTHFLPIFNAKSYDIALNFRIYNKHDLINLKIIVWNKMQNLRGSLLIAITIVVALNGHIVREVDQGQ